MSSTITIDGQETWPRPGYGAMGELYLLPFLPPSLFLLFQSFPTFRHLPTPLPSLSL